MSFLAARVKGGNIILRILQKPVQPVLQERASLSHGPDRGEMEGQNGCVFSGETFKNGFLIKT